MLAYAIMNEDMKSADHVMRKFGITTPMKQWDHPHPRKGLPQRPKFHWPHLEARFLKVS
jgi:hypothetical protein